MSIRLRKWKGKDGKMLRAWSIDIKVKLPGRGVTRVRDFSPLNTKRGAERYEHTVRQSLIDGSYFKKQEVECPTFDAFLSRYTTYCENNNKYSTNVTKKRVIERHLQPFFGRKRLDQIGMADIETFKAEMRKKVSYARATKTTASKWAVKKRYGTEPRSLSPKTVNNVLTCLRKMLSVAEEQGVIRYVPRVKHFKTEKPQFDYLSFDEAERLVAATEGADRLALLLACRAGLRIGEILALKWSDVDTVRGRIVVRRNFWRGHLNEVPKGGRTRTVELPKSLVDALRAHKHLNGSWVLCTPDGEPLSAKQLDKGLNHAVRRAGIAREQGRVGWHDLRHTYGSHLAMRAVPMRTIQELMGHATVEMTMRYAHLSPDTTHHAVQVLDEPTPAGEVGAHEGHMRGPKDVTG